MSCPKFYGLIVRPGQLIGTTPFVLTYGMKAIIPIEVDMPTTKMVIQGQRDENQALERHLDLVDEVRGNATILMVSYQ